MVAAWKELGELRTAKIEQIMDDARKAVPRAARIYRFDRFEFPPLWKQVESRTRFKTVYLVA